LVELQVIPNHYQIAPYLNFEGRGSALGAARNAEQRLRTRGL